MSIPQHIEATPVGVGPRGSPRRQRPSVVLREVLPRIERSDKLAVAVELESRVAAAKEPLADPAFRGLAPARMVDLRIHVRIEAIFARLHHVPCRLRLLVGSVIRTTDLMDLKPYFHGTTSRIGAPFCLGIGSP